MEKKKKQERNHRTIEIEAGWQEKPQSRINDPGEGTYKEMDKGCVTKGGEQAKEARTTGTQQK